MEGESKSAKSAKVTEWFDQNSVANEMETSLDEGIGSSGSLSLSNVHANAKNSPIAATEFLKHATSSMPVDTMQSRVSAFMGFDTAAAATANPATFPLGDDFKIGRRDDFDDDDDDDETNLGDVVDRCYDDVADLDVNVDDDEINNINEDDFAAAADEKDLDLDLDEEYTSEFKHQQQQQSKAARNVVKFFPDEQTYGDEATTAGAVCHDGPLNLNSSSTMTR